MTNLSRLSLFRSIFASIGAIALCSTALFAQLNWETTEQSFNATFSQEEVVATYKFTNTSDKKITITDAKASCGCTVPSLTKKVYEPGESGELKAVFEIGARQGAQHKTITVTTLAEGESEEKSASLILDVEIPVPVTLKPRVRFWKIGSEAEPQEVTITLDDEFALTIDGFTRKIPNDSADFDYELKTVVAGKEYVLSITPTAPNTKSRDVVYLTSKDDEDRILQRFPIYAYVR